MADQDTIFYHDFEPTGTGTVGWKFRLCFIAQGYTDLPTTPEYVPIHPACFYSFDTAYDSQFDRDFPYGFQNSDQLKFKLNLTCLSESDEMQVFKQYLLNPTHYTDSLTWLIDTNGFTYSDVIPTGNCWILYTDNGSGDNFSETTWTRIFEGVQRSRTEKAHVLPKKDLEIAIDEMGRFCLESITPETVSKYIYYNFIDIAQSSPFTLQVEHPAEIPEEYQTVPAHDQPEIYYPYVSYTSQHRYAYNYLFTFNTHDHGNEAVTDADIIHAYSWSGWNTENSDTLEIRMVNRYDLYCVIKKLAWQVRAKILRRLHTAIDYPVLFTDWALDTTAVTKHPSTHNTLYEQSYTLDGDEIVVDCGDVVPLTTKPTPGNSYAGAWFIGFAAKNSSWDGGGGDTSHYYDIHPDGVYDETAWREKCVDGFLYDQNKTSLFKFGSMWEFLRDDADSRLCKGKTHHAIKDTDTGDYDAGRQMILVFGGAYDRHDTIHTPPYPAAFAPETAFTERARCVAIAETDIENVGKDEYKVTVRADGVPPEGRISIPITLHSTPTCSVGKTYNQPNRDHYTSDADYNNFNFNEHVLSYTQSGLDIDQLFYLRKGTDGAQGVSDTKCEVDRMPIRCHSYVKIKATADEDNTPYVSDTTAFRLIPLPVVDRAFIPDRNIPTNVNEVLADFYETLVLPEQRLSGYGYHAAYRGTTRFTSLKQALIETSVPIEYVLPTYCMGNYIQPDVTGSPDPVTAKYFTDDLDDDYDNIMAEGFIMSAVMSVESGLCKIKYIYIEET